MFQQEGNFNYHLTTMNTIRYCCGFIAPVAAGAGSGLSTAIGVAGLGLSLVGTVMNYQAQQAAAEAQAEYQRRQMEQRQKALALEQQTLRIQQQEQQESLAREEFQGQLEGRRERASLEAAAASAGVTGGSVDAIVQEFDLKMGMYNESIDRQHEILNRSTELELEGAGQQFQTDAAAINRPIARPSAFGLALGLGSTLLNSPVVQRAATTDSGINRTHSSPLR